MRPAWSLLVFCFACSSNGTQVTATTPDPKTNTVSRSKNGPTIGNPFPMPVKFVGDRFYVEPMTEDGHTLRFFTDTGGGLMLSRDAAERLGLSVEPIEVDGQPTETALLPAFTWDVWIPKLEVSEGRIPVVDTAEVKKLDRDIDGVLGQAWFKDRVWTFDYGEGQMLLRAAGDLPKHDPHQRAFLGFPKNAEGKRGANYPRIEVQVDGVTIDLLFDTGATVKLNPAALAKIGDGGPAVRATSFISATTFEGWQKKHPEWRVVENADANVDNEPMIEVPTITVAGTSVGPVWFTRRPDKNFHEWMSQWMDKTIDGALGGSALKYFRVHVDYPRAMAVFEYLDDKSR